MPITIPILATVAVWPVCAAARVGLAWLIGLYCGATNGDNRVMVQLARTSSVEIALYAISTVWVAWGIANVM